MAQAYSVRIRNAAMVMAFAFLSYPAPAQQALPRPDPTPRDIYVGCYLYLQGIELPRDDQGLARPYSAARCGGLAVLAIARREGRVPGQRNDLRFCLPDTADVDTDPARAMAAAYIDWYERTGSRMPQREYAGAFTIAMISRWPCEGR